MHSLQVAGGGSLTRLGMPSGDSGPQQLLMCRSHPVLYITAEPGQVGNVAKTILLNRISIRVCARPRCLAPFCFRLDSCGLGRRSRLDLERPERRQIWGFDRGTAVDAHTRCDHRDSVRGHADELGVRCQINTGLLLSPPSLYALMRIAFAVFLLVDESTLSEASDDVGW